MTSSPVPTGKIPRGGGEGGARRRRPPRPDAIVSAKRLAARKLKEMREHPTFAIAPKQKDGGFSAAAKGGQVSMTGIVDRFVAQHSENLLLYFKSCAARPLAPPPLRPLAPLPSALTAAPVL